MKTILRLFALMVAAAVGGVAGCGGGGGGGCGGGGADSSSSNTPTPITCGPGTVQQGNTCVATTPVK